MTFFKFLSLRFQQRTFPNYKKNFQSIRVIFVHCWIWNKVLKREKCFFFFKAEKIGLFPFWSINKFLRNSETYRNAPNIFFYVFKSRKKGFWLVVAGSLMAGFPLFNLLYLPKSKRRKQRLSYGVIHKWRHALGKGEGLS